ncbi:DUF418 domain-containing protein [Bacillus canaveralius]|uniref:DUF418 domain-containing protein n=1 Tax=Bacillus canaveralius TaxID=1403243 RepID=UPI000F78FF45|nr:DUF418 domain-containing protein [Bacillus canaveralius]RSK46923.1 DUF418 domain-containing protein [Bacillus canaveralius]
MPTINKRITSIDTMRGVAILGIFLVNMMSFHSPILYIDPLQWWNEPVDKAVYVVIDVFAQASFYPLFALLFGYGLMILRERVLARQANFTPIALRRLFLLLMMGIIHAFFIWHGDILITYAVFGFIALLFLKLPGKALMLTGTLLYTIANIIFGILVIGMVMFTPEAELTMYDHAAAALSQQIYQEGSFSEITVQRATDWYMVNNFVSFFLMLSSILPLFLIGAGAAKLKWLEHPEEHKQKLRKILVVTLISGLLIKISPYLLGRNVASEFVQDFFGGTLLAISYALMVAFAVRRPATAKLLMPFATVGRMSLSNYLLQSIVSMLIFYSYGLGFYGDISLAGGTVLVVFIFAFQIIISQLWMKHFLYGPFEWLWRCFTYLKLQKLKRTEIELKKS